MRTFKHLSKTKRLLLEQYLKLKMSKREIANLLNVHISTIYREIKRGLVDYLIGSTWDFVKVYSCDYAEQEYRRKLKDKGVPIKLGNDYALANYIENRIVNDGLSPLAVLGEIKQEGLKFKTSISVNTLYKYIRIGVFQDLTLEHLPNYEKRRKRKKKSVVIKRAPKGTSIEERPKEIRERVSFGHFEMDCVCGRTKASFLVLCERLTRKVIIMPMQNQKSESVIKCLDKLERKFGKNFKKIFKSITVDNGSEFADFKGLERSVYSKNKKRTNVYYCHPHCPSERGSNERLNREIRRKVKKGTNLATMTAKQVQDVEDWVNNYPRKVLNFEKSGRLFDKYVNELLVA